MKKTYYQKLTLSKSPPVTDTYQYVLQEEKY